MKNLFKNKLSKKLLDNEIILIDSKSTTSKSHFSYNSDDSSDSDLEVLYDRKASANEEKKTTTSNDLWQCPICLENFSEVLILYTINN